MFNNLFSRFFRPPPAPVAPAPAEQKAPAAPPPSEAYAAVYPLFEQQTPQYPHPNPYALAAEGYRKNELIFACISKRALAISEAPLLTYDDTGETPEEIDNHALQELLRRPCEGLTQEEFWQAVEIYLLIAGFAAFEKERNRLGEVIALWPMRPDWCSFLRGDRRPLRAVRYQPSGLAPQDIPAEDVLLFRYFDPLSPLLKGLSPSMVASRVSGVDNNATDFLKIFFERGAVVNGLLKTVQNLTDTQAETIRKRWREQRGGVQNWADVAVLGAGTEYQQTQMNFRDMAFPELDGRDEARICMTMQVPPILVGAKVGLAASTFSNFGEARKAFYDETVKPEWTRLAGTVREALLPDFEDQPKLFVVGFDLSQVSALQEDRTAKFTRANTAFTSNWLTRDEARQEAGYDPVDNRPVFFAEVGAMALPDMGAPVGVVDGAATGTLEAPEAPAETAVIQDVALNGAQVTAAMDIVAQVAAATLPRETGLNSLQILFGLNADQATQILGTAGKSLQLRRVAIHQLLVRFGVKTWAESPLVQLERKQFRAFARKRLAEGQPQKVQLFKFKHTPLAQQQKLLAEFFPPNGSNAAVVTALNNVAVALRDGDEP